MLKKSIRYIGVVLLSTLLFIVFTYFTGLSRYHTYWDFLFASILLGTSAYVLSGQFDDNYLPILTGAIFPLGFIPIVVLFFFYKKPYVTDVGPDFPVFVMALRYLFVWGVAVVPYLLLGIFAGWIFKEIYELDREITYRYLAQMKFLPIVIVGLVMAAGIDVYKHSDISGVLKAKRGNRFCSSGKITTMCEIENRFRIRVKTNSSIESLRYMVTLHFNGSNAGRESNKLVTNNLNEIKRKIEQWIEQREPFESRLEVNDSDKIEQLKREINGLFSRSDPIGAVDFSHDTPGGKLEENKSSDSQPIVEVYSQNIYKTQVQPSSNQIKRAKESKSKEEYQEWLRKNQFERFQSLFFDAIRQRYLKVNKLKATDAEIVKYINHMNEFMSKEQRRNKKKIKKIKKQLKSDNLSEKRRKRLEQRLSTLEEITNDEILNSSWSPEDPNQRRIARQKIEQWKFRHSLFEKHGGNLYFQQFGLEPLEAMEAHLRSVLKSNQVTFNNKSFLKAFDDFYEYVDKFQESSDGMGEETIKQFNKPPWKRKRH